MVVPPGDEVKNISCPVCKESLKSEFLEDDEEWVWRNAVLVKDKVMFDGEVPNEVVANACTRFSMRRATLK